MRALHDHDGGETPNYEPFGGDETYGFGNSHYKNNPNSTMDKLKSSQKKVEAGDEWA